MFWPIFYSIIFIQIALIVRTYPGKFTRFILGICCLIQLADTSAGWIALKTRLNYDSKVSPTNLFTNQFWNNAATHHKTIRVQPLVNGQFQPRWEHLAPFAAKNYLGTNAVYLARVDQIKLNDSNIAFERNLLNRELNQKTLYVLDDSKILPALLNINRDKDLLAKVDNFVVLAPGWKSCKSCPQINSELEIKNIVSRPRIGIPIEFNDANDNLRLMLAGGHGWLPPSVNGVGLKQGEAKIVIPFPGGANLNHLTLAFKVIKEQSNYPRFSVNGRTINFESHNASGITAFKIPITTIITSGDYLQIEIYVKNVGEELKSATFN